MPIAKRNLLRDRLPLLTFCLGLIGCSEQERRTIALVPPASIVVADETLLIASVPPGMSLARKLLLQSRFETQLTNLKTVSSCGCTSAKLDKDTLAPGGMVALNYVFDGGVVAQSQNVRIRLFSPDIPSASFMIDMRFKTDPSQSDIQVAATPKNVFFDELWQKEHKHQYRFVITFGEDVPLNSIDVSTSSDFILADLQGTLLKVTLKSPPVGKIDEYVAVSFPHAKGTYSLKIPIRGEIRPLIGVTPKFISFGEIPRGEGMTGEVLIKATNGQLEQPEIVLKGDWKIQSLEKVTGRTWKLRVFLKVLAGKDLRYGTILVKGNWRGEPIKIPITGNFARGNVSSTSATHAK